jgi:hypothetical protein
MESYTERPIVTSFGGSRRGPIGGEPAVAPTPPRVDVSKLLDAVTRRVDAGSGALAPLPAGWVSDRFADYANPSGGASGGGMKEGRSRSLS